MIVVEEKHEQESDREGHEYPLDVQIPEIDKPAAIDGWVERAGMWQLADICCFQLAGKMGESRPEDCGYLLALDKLTSYIGLWIEPTG